MKVSSVASYYVGGTINVDTGDGGDRLESRTITSIGTAPTSTTRSRSPRPRVTRTSRSTASRAWPSAASSRSGSSTATITSVGTAATNTTLAAASTIGEAGTPPPSLQGASWIWNVAGASTDTPAGTIYIRKTFTVADPASITRAQLRINGDDSHVTYVNGQQVAQSGTGNNAWQTSQIVDIKSRLVAGTNVIAVAGDQRRQLRQLDRRAAARRRADRHRHDVEGARGHAGDAAGGLEHGRVRRLGVARRVLVRRSTASRRGTRTSRSRPTPNPSNLKVASVTGFAVGDTITVDTGANQETRTISAVGTAGANGTGITVSPPFDDRARARRGRCATSPSRGPV